MADLADKLTSLTFTQVVRAIVYVVAAFMIVGLIIGAVVTAAGAP